MTEAPLSQATLLEAAEQKQQRAASPAVSAWVHANAGTGKTHVLVQRILRLLLSGADPRAILCLTFTKNAAAEMESRVLSKLSEWATSSDEELRLKLANLFARAPSPAETMLARCLFATVIDAPGGLAIMTIHGFCERVLRRFSFEANVPPGFSVLTGEEAREALAEASASAFASAALGPLREALECAAAHAGEAEFSSVLRAMLGKRNAIAHLFRLTAEEQPLPAIKARSRALFGLAPEDTRQTLTEQGAAVLDTGALREAVAALSGGTPADCKGAMRFEAALAAKDADARFTALREAFTTKSGEPRKALMTAGVKKRAAALHERLGRAQEAFRGLDTKICALKLVEASAALLRLTEAIFERYEAAKRTRTALDFDDLIARTLSLLSRRDAAEWVLYQLDARIDHVLVDEAQDTSPEQWAIVEKLTSDFFAGEGARECVPTLFAVGDEKQSIYGFQGAVPELLGAFGTLYEVKTREAGLAWCKTDLDLSFRSLGAVLSAVDGVSAALPELQDAPVRHLAYRRDAGGLVELWPPERGEKADKDETVWNHSATDTPVPKPAEALASRIAAQIRHWLDNEDYLPSQKRAVEPGDILILLRKREPLASLLQAALKRQGVPVAGADRVTLISELAVMDLLALADCLLQPEDDLSLAAVLKGPLFGLSEDALFELAYGREGSLWRALQRAPSHHQAAETLSLWRELAVQLKPFDFFAHILEAGDARTAFAARLGAGCFDAIDEFLNLAETFSARPEANLSAFVSFARKSASEVKRETDQEAREVRIMTVHGAKGLEANIVILADTCSNKGAAGAPVFFLEDGTGAPDIPVWAIKGTGSLQPVAATKSAIKESERRELGRLLYVAMTRARDRLYIAGFHNGALPAGCWYETIQTTLAPMLTGTVDFEGRPIWRGGSVPEPQRSTRRVLEVRDSLPEWAALRAAREDAVLVLPPSRLLKSAGAGDAALEPSAGIDRKSAQSRGTLVHRLLEVLPALKAEHWDKASQLIASAFAFELTAQMRKDAAAGAVVLLSSEAAPLFRGSALSEAGLAVVARDASGTEIASILGQADRIFVSEDGVTVADYKSGSLPGDGTIRPAHLAQLACYRLALQRIYPEASIQAVLFNTRSGKLVRATSRDLDAILENLL